MPIYRQLSNLIIPLATIESKYAGGADAFRKEYIIPHLSINQEDNELFSLSAMNPQEFDIQALLSKGLEFDFNRQYSKDFVIVSRYDGKLWSADWLNNNGVFAWHKECSQEQINKAIELSKLSMDEISKLFEVGVDPFRI